MLILYLVLNFVLATPISPRDDPSTFVYQVDGPRQQLGDPVHTQVLAQHVFAKSWDAPFSTAYKPQEGVNFTHVELTLTSRVSGVQYDRLAHIFLGGAEIWRSCMAEPAGRAILSAYTKDVSQYSALFRSATQLTIRLDNIVEGGLSGEFDVTLVAKFYNFDKPNTHASISAFLSNPGSPSRVIPMQSPSASPGTLNLVPDRGESLQFDVPQMSRDTVRVVLDIFASGNADEEFWYSNVLPQHATNLTDNVNLRKSSPLRVINVFIDDKLAGVAAPFPIIYTGGLSPSLWTPIVGLNAFDVPSYQLDLTVYLPILWQQAAKISIAIADNWGSSSKIQSNWILNANLLTWNLSGVSGNGTLGQSKHLGDSGELGGPRQSDKSSTVDQLVWYSANISQSSKMNYTTSSGTLEDIDLTWHQSVDFGNLQTIFNGGNNQDVAQSSSGFNKLTAGTHKIFESQYSYPMVLGTGFLPSSDEYLYSVKRVYHVKNPLKCLRSHQNGTLSSTGSKGFLTQNLAQKIEDDHFQRSAQISNGRVDFDRNTGTQDELSQCTQFPDPWEHRIRSSVARSREAGLAGLARENSKLFLELLGSSPAFIAP